jgi:hypothetical protein
LAGREENYRAFPARSLWDILGNFLRHNKFTVPLLEKKVLLWLTCPPSLPKKCNYL